MTDQAGVDLASLVHTLLQQQAALLEAHSESLRLQRLLMERLLGSAPPTDIGSPDPRVDPQTQTRAAPLPNQVIPPPPRSATASAEAMPEVLVPLRYAAVG
jgi:hypothetical protein